MYRDFFGPMRPPNFPSGPDEFFNDFGSTGSGGDLGNFFNDDFMHPLDFIEPTIKPEVDEFLQPSPPLPPSGSLHEYYTKPSPYHRHGHGLMPIGSSSDEVFQDKDNFRIKIDVQQFTPEEIEVQTRDNFVVIEAKHTQTVDDNKFVTRKFQRRYFVPPNVDSSELVTKLDSGVLTIEAPCKAIGKKKDDGKILRLLKGRSEPVNI